jgi:putative ABC transport system permease protein
MRSLRASRTRNIIAICAIALTAVLFTTVFTLGGSLLSATQEQTMRQVGTSAHGGLKYLTMEQYEHFKRSPLIKDISYNIVLAIASNPALNKLQCEIRYSEDDAAKWQFSYPAIGKMPQTDNEIACSTVMLDALGIPREIGASIPLEFAIGEREYSETFTLCGYWEGDKALGAQQVWLSKGYIDSVLSENVLPQDRYVGTVSADLWFSNSFDIEGAMKRLIAERGYGDDEIRYGLNWAYAAADIDPTMVAIAAFVIALILLSGYLIIYSIFAISVNADIRFYGLLKTIGATGRQIRRVVHGQALALSAVGIPLGLIIGFGVGCLLSPILLSLAAVTITSGIVVNPLIFVFAAAFSLFTVFISCRKPGRIAAKVSPVEAAKFGGAATKRKSKRTGAVTPLSFAAANITRDKKKLCVVVLSLSLSLILLNGAFSAVNSFDMDEYVSRSIISDFAITHYSILGTQQVKNYEGMSADFLREAKNHGAAEASNIYYEQFSVPDKKPMQYYGIGETELESFSSVSYDKLRSGDYVIVSKQIIGDGSVAVPQVGDTVTLVNASGAKRDFTVIEAVDEYPHQLSSRFIFGNSLTFALADDVFLDFFGTRQPLQTDISVPSDKIGAFEEWMNDYTTAVEPDLAFISRNTLKAEFDGLKNTYAAIGGALSFVLALIGILNFTNAIIVSIFARRREFAMLQSIGMTGRQLKQTLIFEGGGYTVLTAAFTFTIGLGLTYLITRLIAGQVWFFKQSVTVFPSVICLPLLLILCAVVPVVCYAKLTRESVVERLRVE